MLLTNSRTIREVVLFPLLRTESAEPDAPPESQSA
jgi:aspartyl-tRNA synthetase